jgi:hypothetical protein
MTTYVLGADASAHVGYPLTTTLGSELLSWMKKQTRFDLYAPTASSLEETFHSTANLEDLLTEMVSTVSAVPANTRAGIAMRERFRQDYHVLSDALQERFGEIRENPAGAYEHFCAHVVRPGDCIITFNYDVSVDRELRRAGKWHVGDGYGFTIVELPEKSPVKILKLHGSSNWLASLWQSPGDGFGWRPVISDAEMSFLGYTDQRDLNFRNARSGMVPTLILPRPEKEFFIALGDKQELRLFFDDLWNQAKNALGQSDSVVICGYSMPDTDERARKLLIGNSLGKGTRITVVSGSRSDDIAKCFRDQGYKYASAAHTTYRFEDWAASAAFAPGVS